MSTLKELRPRSGRDVAIRVLFVFDPWSLAVLLVAGNKAGDWTRWYEKAIPMAEVAYEGWLAFERKRRGRLMPRHGSAPSTSPRSASVSASPGVRWPS
ncbi:type II toxin-antitoxin system RelE/ParE family toxin [Micromonospora sp. NPDC050686]|uniref:type II toxin-antitoxin system RelE/ParE family toxin n=1 Tax=Micromonospora sp. NPDC050686 TaxID=3154631 RepID=UPI0033E26600